VISFLDTSLTLTIGKLEGRFPLGSPGSYSTQLIDHDRRRTWRTREELPRGQHAADGRPVRGGQLVHRPVPSTE
jgi:hypothetical protein